MPRIFALGLILSMLTTQVVASDAESGRAAVRGDIGADFLRALTMARQGESLRAADLLDALARRLRTGAGLGVRFAALVEHVEGYGIFRRDARRTFRPGERLLVYAEVVGFDLREAENGYSLALNATYELRPALGGGHVGSWGPDPVRKATASPVRDLFVTRFIALSADLAPGRYMLRIVVADEHSGEDAVGVVLISVTE